MHQILPSIDQFFHDTQFGYLKFKGYEEGEYLFRNYENFSSQRWMEASDIKMNPDQFTYRLTHKIMRKSVPPQ